MKIKINCSNTLLNREYLKEIPKELIYSYTEHIKGSGFSQGYDINVHKMADMRTGNYVGKMITRVKKNVDCTYIYPEKSACNALEIVAILLKERKKGFGSKFLKFAKYESLKSGCEGRVFLCASRLFNINHPPHIFYKKNGYVSVSKKMNKLMDDCIKNGTELDIKQADDLLMYLPVKEEPQKTSGFSKLLKKLFSKFI